MVVCLLKGPRVFFISRPMLTTLSAVTPRARPPVHFDVTFVAAAVEPCRRLVTLTLSSDPVRHFRQLRNQRFFCSRLRLRLLVERLGMQTRTPRVHIFIVEISVLKNYRSPFAKTAYVSLTGRSRAGSGSRGFPTGVCWYTQTRSALIFSMSVILS